MFLEIVFHCIEPLICVCLLYVCNVSRCLLYVGVLTAYPAVYGQFAQAIPQPIAAVAASQREGNYQH